MYDWDEYEQGLALGAYYWLHWISQLPGGLLARRYGTKKVFGISNLIVAILGLLIPIATQYHLYGLVTIRIIQGLISVTIKNFNFKNKKTSIICKLFFLN